MGGADRPAREESSEGEDEVNKGDFRRSKAEIDPSILEKVLAVIAVGAGRGVASAQAGISRDTLRMYEHWGRDAWAKREAGEEKLTPREVLFAAFFERLKKAETSTETYMLGLLQKAASGDWKAGAWLLEKLHPKRYGARVELEHSGSIEKRDLSNLTVEELFQLRDLTKKIEGDPDE